MTRTYVIIEDNVVTNFILWDKQQWPSLYTDVVEIPSQEELLEEAAKLIPEGVRPDIILPTIGDTYVDGTFSTTREWEWDDENAKIYWKGPGNFEIRSDYQPR